MRVSAYECARSEAMRLTLFLVWLAVHAQGSFMFLQLFAPGRAASAEVLKAENPGFGVVGPSAVAFEGGDVPRELTEEEIGKYVDWFEAAARSFVNEAGGDGVEGELSTLHQFATADFARVARSPLSLDG